MTNRTGGTVRRLAAGALGAAGLFVAAIGLGMTRWAVVAVGVALIAVAVGLAASATLRGRQRAWQTASAHVISASARPVGQQYGRAELELVLTGPGLPATAMTVRDPRAPVDRWPVSGTALPVLVAVDDRRRVRIQWDDAPVTADAAAADAAGGAATHDAAPPEAGPHGAGPRGADARDGRPADTPGPAAAA
ncbi:MAG TPA: glyoxalase/bleomycin resistance/dioxygenase family protein, partial [Pilimelia sp.]|nr:glyoxalase/bleomycin resistance/dioxygenase family protein [Pilimelia sp.]